MVALDLPDRLQPVFLRLFRDELNVEESALVGTECVVSCCGATDNARADIGDDIADVPEGGAEASPRGFGNLNGTKVCVMVVGCACGGSMSYLDTVAKNSSDGRALTLSPQMSTEISTSSISL